MQIEVNGTRLWFDVVGHFPWLDDPDRYWRLIQEFVIEAGPT